MVTIARRAPGQSCRQCRWPALEIAARAEHAVRINDDAGVAIGEMVTADRRHDRLIIDAGVGHQHAKGAQRVDCPLFERRHPLALPKPAIDREIDAARVGDRRHPHPPLRFRRSGEPFEKAHPGLAQGLGIGHHVRLRHRHKIGRVEEFADRDLMRDRPTPNRAETRRPASPVPRRSVASQPYSAATAILRAIRSSISASPSPVSRRMSRECSPNRGAGWRNVQSAALKRTGGRTVRMRPSLG